MLCQVPLKRGAEMRSHGAGGGQRETRAEGSPAT